MLWHRSRLLLLPLLFGVPQDPTPDPGSPAARASVDQALRWLIRAQNSDGSWGDNPGNVGEVGNTCIATLAILATGATSTRGELWRPVQKALAWLALRAGRFGEEGSALDRNTLLQSKLGQNIDLYLITLLYSQVLGHAPDVFDDQHIQRQLQFAADRIASLQKPSGEWETSYEPMLTTLTAWLALRQASDAGITIRHASPRLVLDYLKRDCLEPATGVFREAKWNKHMRFVTQAGAIRVLCSMGEGDTVVGRRAKQVVLGMRFDQDVGGRSGGEEFLGAVFATQAFHIEGDPAFGAWYAKIVASLRACQNRDGSWQGHHCITGRVFCTACAILTLLTPDKLLPMVER